MSDIHRLLDEAFAGSSMTPDLQDLKEELRGNLLARAEELQSRGMDAATAASTAIAELDIPELIAGIAADGHRATTPGAQAAELARLNRVRPKPGFVILAVLLSLAIAGSAVVVGLVAVQVVQALGLGIAGAALFGVAVAALTDGSLRQETAQHYRMPSARAIGYGLAGGALGAGLALGGLFAGHPDALGLLVSGILLTLAAIVAFVALGVTQTNRVKPWAVAQARQYEAEDRFSQDPVAAARFGLYTVIIWTVAIALFIALSIAIGFVWSWLALVAGVVVFFLVLTRMLFPAEHAKKQ